MDIRPAPYAEILAQGSDLFHAYAEECAIPEIGHTNPQADTYAAMERAGIAQCFGVYSDAELVGFASVLTSLLPHYGKKVAVVESIFISPKFRPLASLDLMKAIEQHSTLSGCVAILYSAPAGSRFELFLTLRNRYRHTNTVFCKALL